MSAALAVCPAAAGNTGASSPVPANDAAILYRRTAHVCRTCLGPVMEHGGGYVCAVCDASGATPSSICGCGIKVQGPGGRRRLFACTPNPARGPASPSGYVITFAPEAI